MSVVKLAEIAMEPTASDDGADFQLTAQWALSRTFIFRAEPRGEILSCDLSFLRDGTIAGYHHPNERRWSLLHGQLHMLSDAGFATCSFSFAGSNDGLVSLRGDFCDPRWPETPSGVVHFLDEIDPAGRRDIQSFDLFDTLVARRCVQPTAVFRAVECKAGATGFAALRHQVEMRIFGLRPYGLDDVYQALGHETGWPPHVLARLKMLELAEEWDNCVPIRAMTAKVRPQDLIISDMYLPYDFVRKIASLKCGLAANALYLSNYGKHNATVWKQLAPRYRITRHYGDNLHADVSGPARYGVPTEHVRISELSPAEKILCDSGMRPQAQAIREARLALQQQAAAIMAAQQAQLHLNLPLLLVGAYYLLDRARELEADSLLLCGRDCNLWAPLTRLLAAGAPHRPRVHYIAASRAAFYCGDAEYDAYFHSFLGERNLLVDLVGTGRSPAHFLERCQLSERVTSLILVGAPAAEMPGSFRLETLLQREFRPFRLALEALNLSLEGSALRARFVDFELTAERAANEFDAEGQKLIAAQQRAFLDALPLLSAPAEQLAPPPRAALAAAAAALVELIPSHLCALAELSRQIIANLT